MTDAKSPYDKLRRAAVVQYMGIPGSSDDCRDAVVRLLQHGDRVATAKILTYGNEHAFLLTVNAGDQVIIKSGFASGYGGGGPNAFSYVLQLLETHGVEIDELRVTEELIARVELSCLRQTDLAVLAKQRPVRPARWRDYIFERHWEWKHKNSLWIHHFPLVIPLAVVDPRIIDLALSFWDAPADRLLAAFRRLEDTVRRRTKLKDHGAKLFALAFMGDTAVLRWEGCNEGETAGRAELFRAAFIAHRNPRAHREIQESAEDQLSEFLIVNQLFRLERNAVATPRRRKTRRRARTSPDGVS